VATCAEFLIAPDQIAKKKNGGASSAAVRP